MDAVQAQEVWPRAEISVNPLQAAESHHFETAPRGSHSADYRSTAITDVARRGLPFQSTCNTIFVLMEQTIPHMLCPYCRANRHVEEIIPLMRCMGHGGGNGVTFSIGYRCEKCSATASLTLTTEGLSFSPREG